MLFMEDIVDPLFYTSLVAQTLYSCFSSVVHHSICIRYYHVLEQSNGYVECLFRLSCQKLTYDCFINNKLKNGIPLETDK